jgi:hypothetical protein
MDRDQKALTPTGGGQEAVLPITNAHNNSMDGPMAKDLGENQTGEKGREI